MTRSTSEFNRKSWRELEPSQRLIIRLQIAAGRAMLRMLRPLLNNLYNKLSSLKEYPMPGPVSDSHDPEFGTNANAAAIADGIEEVIERISQHLGSELKDIVEVALGDDGPECTLTLTERQLRLIRFGLRRALESL